MKLSVFLAGLMGVVLGGASVFGLVQVMADSHEHTINCAQHFSLLNPWIRCEEQDSIAKQKEFSQLKNDLREKIEDWKAQGNMTEASVYLRDLSFGPWMGIEEDHVFSSASLLKIPVMLAILRAAQSQPDVLRQRVELPSAFLEQYVQEFKPRDPIVAGESYTVEELLWHMITESNNNATLALNTYLDTISSTEPLTLITLEELGFLNTDNLGSDDLTVKQIASMFRLLYNGSYLNKEMSQKALELLSHSTFKKGIVAGVPHSITVAHKFGERLNETGEKQLHDCGIVYHPSNPYLLCIMTSGWDMNVLSTVIADISELVYTEIDQRTTLKF